MAKTQLRRTLHLAAALIVVALLVGLYRAKSDAARTQAHVRELEAEIVEREARLRELRAEIAELESPARIERMARERGMAVGAAAAARPHAEIPERLPAPRQAPQR